VKPKYIVIEYDGMEAVLIFSPTLLHQEVAGKSNVKSAGYCRLDASGNWVVSGNSISLSCGARPQDVKILNELL
jgi:hypothetical protein